MPASTQAGNLCSLALRQNTRHDLINTHLTGHRLCGALAIASEHNHTQATRTQSRYGSMRLRADLIGQTKIGKDFLPPRYGNNALPLRLPCLCQALVNRAAALLHKGQRAKPRILPAHAGHNPLPRHGPECRNIRRGTPPKRGISHNGPG